MPTSPSFPAASVAASPCARFCSKSPICCCSTNRRTISMPKAWTGWNATWPNIPAPSSPSPTIATFSTTSPSGFSNSTAAAAFPGKATTPLGSSRKKPASPSKKNRPPPARKPCSANWNGFASPRARQAKSKARINAYEQMSQGKLRGARTGIRNPNSARQAPGQAWSSK